MQEHIVWGTYGTPTSLVSYENRNRHAHALLGSVHTGLALSEDKNQAWVVHSVQVIENLHESNSGVIVVDLVAIPEIETDLTWNGEGVVSKNWDPRLELVKNVVDLTFGDSEATYNFLVANQEDADVLFQALRRVQSVVVTPEKDEEED